jgi:hypothetical protein
MPKNKLNIINKYFTKEKKMNTKTQANIKPTSEFHCSKNWRRKEKETAPLHLLMKKSWKVHLVNLKYIQSTES